MADETLTFDTIVGQDFSELLSGMSEMVTNIAQDVAYTKHSLEAAIDADINKDGKLQGTEETKALINGSLQSNNAIAQLTVQMADYVCEHLSSDSPEALGISQMSENIPSSLAMNSLLASVAKDENLSEKDMEKLTQYVSTNIGLPSKSELSAMGMSENDADKIATQMHTVFKDASKEFVATYKDNPELITLAENLPDGSDVTPLNFNDTCEAITGKPAGKSI